MSSLSGVVSLWACLLSCCGPLPPPLHAGRMGFKWIEASSRTSTAQLTQLTSMGEDREHC